MIPRSGPGTPTNTTTDSQVESVTRAIQALIMLHGPGYDARTHI